MKQKSDASKPRRISLTTRFAWASGLRIGLLAVVLGVVMLVSVNDPGALSYSVQLVIAVLAGAFALSAVYAWFSKARRYLRVLVPTQLILDQVIWTVVSYLSGGVSSGATSFYGVTCFIGALLGGFRGALVAAVAAVVCYGALAVGLATGILVIPPDQPASAYALSPRDFATSGVATLLMLVTVVLLAGTLAERLRTTGGQLLRAEARADRAEREAALGRLAAGLAHEIRNPLGAISGSVALMSTGHDVSEEQRELQGIILRETERLNDLLSDMLDLANPREPQRSRVALGPVIREVVQLAQHSGRGGTDVAVEAQIDADPDCHADDGMLRQMLWNLVRNAVQASKPGSRVTVVVHLIDDEVCVDVIDHGGGLSEDAKGQIFDPFYTTRFKGTGIGLAVVKRIADQHEFAISVFDTPGSGATFRVNMGQPMTGGPEETARSWTLFPKAGA
jgi:two-component system, NtrC family, sensor histidine kinase HydH